MSEQNTPTLSDRFKEIWQVDVSDEYLEFTQVTTPSDFFQVAEKQPYGELNGTYCGNRSYGDTYFKLIRRLKASNAYSGPSGSNTVYKDQWGNFSLKTWREAHGYAYAWEPSSFYKYEGKLYTTHVNFL